MNILLVEDHPIFRIGVRQIIAQAYPHALCDEADTLARAVGKARSGDYAIAICDLNLPDAQGVEAIATLRRIAPAMKILVLSLNEETAYARRALQLGAAGYIAKNHAGDELVTALQRIERGGRYISTRLAEQLADLASGQGATHPHEALSDQEYRVLLQLATGSRLIDIAAAMHLSPKTISTYRARILDKLHLHNNTELARYCDLHGLH